MISLNDRHVIIYFSFYFILKIIWNSPTSKFKNVYRKKPPVPSKLIVKINKEIKEESENSSIVGINEEISPMAVIKSRKTKTFTKIDQETMLVSKFAKSLFI